MTNSLATRRLEHRVHRTLLTGLILSGVLVSTGLVAALVMESSRPEGPPPTLLALLRGAVRGHGVDLMDLGLLSLMATPMLRVAVLGAGWAMDSDWRFATVAFVVLGLLGLSLMLGMG